MGLAHVHFRRITARPGKTLRLSRCTAILVYLAPQPLPRVNVHPNPKFQRSLPGVSLGGVGVKKTARLMEILGTNRGYQVFIKKEENNQGIRY